MTPADQLLEEQIDAAVQLGLTAENSDVQRAAFAAMARLIAQRSTEQVARMEQAKGLR